jgi:hypothetical protein
MAFDAMTTVAATLGGGPDEREALVKRLNHTHRDALRELDASVGSDHWNEHDFSQLIETQVESITEELTGSIRSSVISSLFRGKTSELEARANSLDASIDKEIDARSDKLEACVQLLCPRLTDLEKLQRQFEFRLADGSRLELLARDPDHAHHDTDEKVARR